MNDILLAGYLQQANATKAQGIDISGNYEHLEIEAQNRDAAQVTEEDIMGAL